MKKAIVYSFLFAGVLSLVSCAVNNGISADDVTNGRAKCNTCGNDKSAERYTPTAMSVQVKRETKKMLQSHIDKMAGAIMNEFTYYLILNDNKTFSTVVNIHGTKQYDFRAGTFKAQGDTLRLDYYKNIKSAYLTDKVLVDNKKGEIYFLNNDLAKTTRLKILNEL